VRNVNICWDLNLNLFIRKNENDEKENKKVQHDLYIVFVLEPKTVQGYDFRGDTEMNNFTFISINELVSWDSKLFNQQQPCFKGLDGTQ
jgi:hypothetical protein